MAARKRRTAQARWPKADWLEHQLAEIGDLIKTAVQGDNLGAAAALKKQHREVRREIDQLGDAAAASDLPATTEIHLSEMLSEVRSMRSQAQTAGSWVAASNLSKRELELVRELEEHRLKLQPAQVELSLEELLDQLDSMLMALPPVVRAKFRAEIVK